MGVVLETAKLRVLLAMRSALEDEHANAPRAKQSDLVGQIELINQELRRRHDEHRGESPRRSRGGTP